MEMSRALRQEVRERAVAAATDEAQSAEVRRVPPASSAELALAFSRVSRAVRQTLALEVRLEEERQSVQQAAPGGDVWTQDRVNGAAARLRARLWRIVHQDDSAPDDLDGEADDPTRADAAEREDDGESEDVGAGISLDAAVGGIRRDLGLDPKADKSLWAGDVSVDAGSCPPESGDCRAAPEGPLRPDWPPRPGSRTAPSAGPAPSPVPHMRGSP